MTRADQGSPEYWAELTPDATAIVVGDATMTYREWNDAADRVAEGLAQRGLDAGDRIGMRFRLGFEWFVIQRALQKLGVTQVAVNWRLTPEEALYILHDSEAKGLACDDADVQGWGALDIGMLITVGQDENAPGIRYEDLVKTECPEPRFGLATAMMVLYTSGTTGRPRGVPPIDLFGVEDPEWLIRFITSVNSIPPLCDKVRTLLTLPVHHGAGPRAVTAAVGKGGMLVVLDPFDAEEALRLIEKYKIQDWTAVPTLMLRLQKLPPEVFSRYDLSSIETIGIGAAVVPQSLKEWIVATFGDDVLWESYGASEAGFLTYVGPKDQLRKPGTSGLPYDGVDLAIIDEDWNRLSTGETGEIIVKTPVVLNHYLGGPELGDDVVRDGYYRTGDAGHLDEDGYLFITDRVKDMIVAGGVNIYPAEIEQALINHPDVNEAAVVGIPEEEFGEQPMAFIVRRPGSTLTEEDLTNYLEGQLARYKRPRKFAFVEEIPHSPMNKVLKYELRAPYWEGRERRV